MNNKKLVVALLFAAGSWALVWAIALVAVRAEYNLTWFALGTGLLIGAIRYRRHLRAGR
jgi:hypothetical protein